MFNVSEKAVNEISRLLSEEEDKTMFLRIRVVPGGCSGFEYEMGFDNEIDGSDEVFEENQVKVVIDKFSLGHIKGGTLNFSDGLNGTGFGIDNPNATAQCGCGSSFTV
jgi:iron-sulfur cluster assembly protein|tara:strand:+ start:449 stop:772 length:324 start_codon:yes stop_codon:yes gene_type:complete